MIVNTRVKIYLNEKQKVLLEKHFLVGDFYTITFSKNIRKVSPIKVGIWMSEFVPVETAISGLYGIYSYRQISIAESGSFNA